MLDIDGSGSFDALTDGLIILRYAFGLRGDNLVNNSVDESASRKTAEQIEEYIQLLLSGNPESLN